ncbi:FimV/HubP family polar landmark protein [Halomonas korlensis]|uniref:FimV N-terminal domain-containing protein n=1 Tax=Halomonas korlensis TaxID=463301 RepID=A0A1I7F9Y2_9GAMM|nr:FimV/HubP family polar landmark protein [Halomonas korlensis]SFU33000.1 FimV N-terminal domain-containing protein [Halomonas korlensis]
MKHKLTLAMLISLSATSHPVMALGVGDVEVRSTLNTPLRASIPLTDTADLEPELIKASIADVRAYATAGLERTPLAASVRLDVSEREGRLMLDMTSERAIHEPWLDLLLRFDWPSGQQLREVTLLLDPPDYDSMPALVMGGANVARSSSAPSSTVDSVPAARAVSPSSRFDASDNAARVSSGDTLWSVAGRLRPDSGISMDQMMVALVEANPRVFPSDNINAMRAGSILVVPSRDALASRTAAEAQRIVASMNQAWANRGNGDPARVSMGSPQAAGEVALASASASPASDGTTRAEEPAGENGASAADVAESTTEPAASNGQSARLTLLTDAQAAASRISAIAPEGAGSGGGEDKRGPAGEPVLGAGDKQVVIAPEVLQALFGESKMTRDARLLRLERRWMESRDALEAVRAERDALQASLGDMRAELDAMRDRLATLSAGGQGIHAPGPGGVVPSTGEANQAADAPWWGAVYEAETNPSLVVGGAGLAVLLALWALVRHRRRHGRTEAYTFGNIPAVGSQGAGTARPDAVGGQEEPAAPVRASMPQAEAINEADIFIAYGRFDQARELLEASLDKEPDRDDLRLKLLMVHLEQGNRQDANRQAEHLEARADPAIQAEVARVMSRLGEVSPLAADHGDPLAPEDSQPEDDSQTAKVETQATPGETPGPEDAKETDEALIDAPVETVEEARRESEAKVESEVKVGGESSDASGAPAPELNSREAEQGRDIIDYQPPALDPAPAARQETPMQPSIEFTSSFEAPSRTPEPVGAGSSSSGTFFGGVRSNDWDVEEVAFPPLDQDNSSPSAGAASALGEARELLQAGDVKQARSLLMDLAADDDATTREEAQSLLTRHDL